MNSGFKSLGDIADSVKKCTRCNLHLYRKNPVPGEGADNATMMIVGEAPGAQEDNSGRPFVGPAGRLLDKALSLVGISRPSVFITNVVKCRPPENRVPRFDEVRSCLPYLVAQLTIVKPKVVVTMGATATIYVSNLPTSMLRRPKSKPVSELRGKTFTLTLGGASYIIVPTYHPAAVLRNRRLWEYLVEDLRKAVILLKSDQS